MAFLGTPHRIFYVAKNLAPGLTGITAKVLRPDNAVVGTFPLSPSPGGASFSGLYYFDLITSVSDPAGEWMAMVDSPSEGIRSPLKVSFERNEFIDINAKLDALSLTLVGSIMDGVVEGTGEVTGYPVDSVDLIGQILEDKVDCVKRVGVIVGIEDSADVIGEKEC